MKINYCRVPVHYKLREATSLQTPLIGLELSGKTHKLFTSGRLTLYPDYRFDGADKFLDMKQIMPAVAVHDFFYWQMRLGNIDKKNRVTIDEFFARQLNALGVPKLAVQAILALIKAFGASHTEPLEFELNE